MIETFTGIDGGVGYEHDSSAPVASLPSFHLDHDRRGSFARILERLPRRTEFTAPVFTCPYPVLRFQNVPTPALSSLRG